jgi:O-antigen/teichoic acid export membrane protein
MSLKRILKLLVAFLTGQGVSLVAQLLVPPLFLRRYASGMEMYGEWLALTAAVYYLNTLNYGIQSYANNQTTIHYNRGELHQAKAVQASALGLILIVATVISLAGCALLPMPVGRWLSLRHIDSFAASLTVFLMLLQLVINMLFSFLVNSYMVIGEAHRGQIWSNAHRLLGVFALAGFIWVRASFPVLAASQLAATALFVLLVLVDLRIKAPFLIPALRYGSARQMKAQLKPSAYFGLLSVSTFLVWQGPVLMIQMILGPASVAAFALSRTVFSMSRQIAVVASLSIGQDITRLVGKKSWLELLRLYELSEKVVLLIIPVSTLGTLLICPLLFTVWLHQRTVYQPGMCLLMAAVSAVISIKEHKWQFQWSSNQHESLSKFNLAAYSLMLAVSALLLSRFGIGAFLCLWLATEIVVAAYIVHLNRQLFPADIHLSTAPLLRLTIVLAAAFALAVWPVWQSAHWSLGLVTVVAVLFTLLLGVASYFIFGLGEVRMVVLNKLRRSRAAKKALSQAV